MTCYNYRLHLRFSSVFCIYIQTNLNLFLLAVINVLALLFLNNHTVADAQMGTDAVCLYYFSIGENGLGIFVVFIANANNNHSYTCVVLGIIASFK